MAKKAKPASYRVNGKTIPRAKLTRGDAYAAGALTILGTPVVAGAYLGGRHAHNQALNRGYAMAAAAHRGNAPNSRIAGASSRKVHKPIGHLSGRR